MIFFYLTDLLRSVFYCEQFMKITTQNFGDLILLTKCALLESTEKIAFLTDVHQSYDGSGEERIPLRDHARQTLNYSYAAVKSEIAGMYNDIYAGIRSEFAIPYVMERHAIPDLIDTDFIEFDTSSFKGYMPEKSLALIESKSGQTVVEITEIGRYQVIDDEPVYIDGYRLDKKVTATNATIIPIRRCIVDGDASNQINALMFKPSLVFRVLDSPEYAHSDDPVQFNNEDVYFLPLLLNGDFIEITFNQRQSIVDGDLGLIGQFTPWFNPQTMKNMRLYIKGKSDFHEFKRWLYRRSGRLNAFWMPTYERNFNYISKGSTGITVKNDNYVDARNHIAIKSGEVWSAHTVTAKTLAGENVFLTLSPYPPAQVDKVCYLGLYRLNADEIQFNFKGKMIVEVTMPILELSP